MKKLLLLISLYLLLFQSVDATIVFRKDYSNNTVLFNNGLMICIPDYLQVRIINDPEGVEISKADNSSFWIDSNFSQNCYTITDCFNVSFSLPFDIKIEQVESSLIISTVNIDLADEATSNDKIDECIKLLKAHKFYLNVFGGLDLVDGFLANTYCNKDNPYLQHATEIAIGQMYFFDQEPLSNDPNRFEKAFNLLKVASQKVYTHFELPKAQICLGIMYLLGQGPADKDPCRLQNAFDLFSKASKMGDLLIQYVAMELIKITEDKISEQNHTNARMMIDNILN
ncbi:MAG: hypothetical protein Q8S31_09360 [Alphaproteobacteria bacterium]|nr:hypothetical protein [Alphaproteobacteria bacterium]